MKQPAILPITPENFDQCWQSIDQLRRKSRRMCAIARIGGFPTNLFFLFSLLFIAVGMIYSHLPGPWRAFLVSLPLFSDLWAVAASVMLKPGDSLTVEVVKLLLGAYGVSILLFIVLALLITLIYHPRRRPVPGGTYAEQTEQLSKAAQEAWSQSFRTKISTSVGSTLLVIVAAFTLFFAYTVYLQDANAITDLLAKFPTQDPATNCLLYVLAAYFVSHIFSTILLLLTRFIYRYQFPHDYLTQAEAALLFAREESEGLTPEEITARRRERAAALRNEAIELEKEAAYQKAKKMFHEAALLGDISAMEHYGRHCLLSHLNVSARYWLERCIATGEASPEAQRMLRRLKLHLNHNTQYLRPDAAPLTKQQKILRALKTIFSILLRILVLFLFLGAIAVCVLLLTDRMEISALTEALSRLFS